MMYETVHRDPNGEFSFTLLGDYIQQLHVHIEREQPYEDEHFTVYAYMDYDFVNKLKRHIIYEIEKRTPTIADALRMRDGIEHVRPCNDTLNMAEPTLHVVVTDKPSVKLKQNFKLPI